MSKSSNQISNLREEPTNLVNFSFCDHKSTFEEFLYGQDGQSTLLVEDRTDFWKFVNKYETMLRAAGQPFLSSPLPEADFDQLQTYHKRKHISLQLKKPEKERKARNCPNESGSELNALKSQQFQEVILIYLDFKQREKFTKIKKLRRAQRALPIARFKKKMQEQLADTRVLIIAGDTGCGKSTQVPQYLYEFGYRSIACTQPRRLACVSLSKRVAHEMLDDYGSKVGFQIRFEKSRTAYTNIVFITEGLLLRQLAVESNLEQYDVLILDEIHERNLFGDFLLGVTKCLLRAKPNMKLILMSATINVELFHKYFQEEGAQLIEVPGRLYPIKTIFMPPPALELKNSASGSKARASASSRLDPAPYVQVLSLIDQKYPTTERGDILIFVSGVNEITTVCEAIKEYIEQQSHWIVLPLHSGLALAEQDKVFDYAPEGMRKCIVSTNIAETSLTVDGIRFVIDSGKVKEMSYDISCKGQRLKEFWVSKSSAEQRKGRAGRTGPGTCFRLFSEKQYNSFESYPTPEIFRVPLDTILLQMVAMGLPNVRAFPFIESPAEESIEQTILSLKQHNALTTDEKITPLGRSLSTLPVDISIGKMLLMGCVFPDVEKILTLAAIMSVQNPFTNRAYTDHKCEQERSELESEQGDIFTLLRVYREWLHLKCDKENTRKWCYKLGIEEQRFYEISKLRNQFQNILENCNMAISNASSKQLSSADRARRHGEVRMLKAIKRKQKYQEPRKRKLLKHNNYEGDNEEFAQQGDDIRDVDFRLNHDTAKMEILLQSARTDKLRDVLLLKLIIVSGFYPQIAMPDEFNYCKGGSQQFFHTFLKPFISLHPNAYFAKYFDLLKLCDSDITDKPPYYTAKQPLSAKHQVLCYQNLLETAKPYLMNCIRMPAAQALLLFSYSIDTNASITRIVCDSWICLDFPLPDTGCELLGRAIKLRRLWNKLLSQKLTDLVQNVESQSTKQNLKSHGEEAELWESLIDFMSANPVYGIKRLLPADAKTLYTQNKVSMEAELMQLNPFAHDFQVVENTEKGGLNVTDNVVYGCLHEVQWTIAMDTALREHSWTCKHCDQELQFNTIAKLLHKKKCRKAQQKQMEDADEKQRLGDAAQPSKPGKHTKYHCSECDHVMHLSKIDILKHRQQCKEHHRTQ